MSLPHRMTVVKVSTAPPAQFRRILRHFEGVQNETEKFDHAVVLYRSADPSCHYRFEINSEAEERLPHIVTTRFHARNSFRFHDAKYELCRVQVRNSTKGRTGLHFRCRRCIPCRTSISTRALIVRSWHRRLIYPFSIAHSHRTYK